jgi:hypothetical protein
MADIDVVKKGSRAWVWVLLAILLVLFLWFLFAGMNTQQTGSIEGGGGQPLVAAVLADVGLVRV